MVTADDANQATALREGGCYCGAIRDPVQPRRSSALECSCSIGSKKAFLGLIVPPDLPWALVMASTLALLLGCDASFVEEGPADVCEEVGVQCVLPDGPLGVCEQIPCEAGEIGPCLVCTPQH